METIVVDHIIKINQGLGWMRLAFNEAAFDGFWKGTDHRAIAKFRAHLRDIEKDVDDHFPSDKKKAYTKAAQDFIDAYTMYSESKFFSKKFNYSSLLTKREIFYKTLNELIAAQNG